MDKISCTKNKLAVAVMLALSSPMAYANMVELGNGDNNFTMLDPAGGRVGGTNDVTAMWDGTFNTSVDEAVTNMTLSSTHPFFGQPWSAHDIQVFGPGTYTFEACPGAIVGGFAADGSRCSSGVSTPQTMTIAEGQAGVHMLFDWNGNVNIDVVNVWDMNAIWGFGPNDGTGKSKLETELSPCIGIGKKADLSTPECTTFFATEWMFTSTDFDGDGVPGSSMVDGPFTGFNANFNIRAEVSAVPVPASLWLMGSGLLGLFGVLRRRQKE